MSLSRLARFSGLLLPSIMLPGCGPKTGGSDNPVAETLAYIREFGFPKLSELLPALPSSLAKIPGVETSASGLPGLPDAFGNAAFGDSNSSLNEVLTDANKLAVQGFSEARRLEAMMLNLAAPIYNMLGQKDLFQSSEESSAKPSTTNGASAMLADGDAQSGNVVANIFEHMVDELDYAVTLGGQNGLPEFLVLGADSGASAIKIAGLWKSENDQFSTGFDARIRINALDDLELTLTLVPSRISGLISEWKKSSCNDDVWQVSLLALPGDSKSLKVTSQECGSARNAVSSVQFAKTSDDDWRFTGGFAQSYPDAGADSLRGFLGKRQGFVVQAAASGNLEQLAGAAAVLGESDFSKPSQIHIDQFGVGQLVARFFQEKYFKPRKSAADSGSIFTNYDNVAYWMCSASTVSDAVQSEVPAAKDLCDNESLDVEAALEALVSLKNAIKGVSLVPSDVSTAVSRLVDILTIRNTLFVSADGALAFKNAPNEKFSDLDESRKSELPSALGDVSWKTAAQDRLPTLSKSQIPDSPFKALTSGLSRFVRKECEALAGDAAGKAKKGANVAALCGG